MKKLASLLTDERTCAHQCIWVWGARADGPLGYAYEKKFYHLSAEPLLALDLEVNLALVFELRSYKGKMRARGGNFLDKNP